MDPVIKMLSMMERDLLDKGGKINLDGFKAFGYNPKVEILRGSDADNYYVVCNDNFAVIPKDEYAELDGSNRSHKFTATKKRESFIHDGIEFISYNILEWYDEAILREKDTKKKEILVSEKDKMVTIFKASALDTIANEALNEASDSDQDKIDRILKARKSGVPKQEHVEAHVDADVIEAEIIEDEIIEDEAPVVEAPVKVKKSKKSKKTKKAKKTKDVEPDHSFGGLVANIFKLAKLKVIG